MGWFINGQWYPDNMIEVGPDGQKRLKKGTKKASAAPPVPIVTKDAAPDQPAPPAEPEPIEPIPLGKDKNDKASSKSSKARLGKADAT